MEGGRGEVWGVRVLSEGAGRGSRQQAAAGRGGLPPLSAAPRARLHREGV